MQNTIFTIDLPLVKTNEDLEKVKGMYPEYDSYFITSGCCKDRRNKIDKLWQKYQPYADKHFLNQVRTNFHQRSWEMYIGNVLLEKNLTFESKNEGPDFVINKTAYIECVAPTKGEPAKPDSVPEMIVTKPSEDIHVRDVPVDKMILRITGVVKDKALGQFENWKGKEWFDSKMPFVIAVNTGALGYMEDSCLPYMLKALFGLQFCQINIETGTTNFSHRDKIEKSNNKPVPVDYFISEEFSFISGVLFSDKLVLNHPENIGEDCVFVNNPLADKPVGDSFVKLFNNWTASKINDKIILKMNYTKEIMMKD